MSWFAAIVKHLTKPGADPWKWLKLICIALDKAKIDCPLHDDDDDNDIKEEP